MQRILTKIGKKSWTAWMPASRLGSSSTSSNGSFVSARGRSASCSRCDNPHARAPCLASIDRIRPEAVLGQSEGLPLSPSSNMSIWLFQHDIVAWLQALASSQTFIYEERERLLALQAENEDLRLQQAEDRARTDCLAATLEASKAGGVLPKEALRAACGPESVNELKLRLASCQNQLAEQVHILRA